MANRVLPEQHYCLRCNQKRDHMVIPKGPERSTVYCAGCGVGRTKDWGYWDRTLAKPLTVDDVFTQRKATP